MTRGRARLWAGLLGLVALGWPAHAAAAANSPTIRDCSFIAGLDPDFVKLTGAAVGPDGALTVPSTQSSVTIEASESSDPGDNLGHDSFSVTVNGPGISAKTVSGTGIGHVTLTVPLAGVATGGQYSLSWSATFDNGFHHCPGSMDPQNTTSNPFVLTVVGGSTALAPKISQLRESRRKWQQRQGTTFTFRLNEPAQVMFVFRRRSHGHLVPSGALIRHGVAGMNSVHFTGRIREMARLGPGHYVAIVTATNSAGQASNRASISFVLKPPSARRA